MNLQRYDPSYTTSLNILPSMHKTGQGEYVRHDEHLALLEKMKCCYNCQHFSKGNPVCDTCADEVSYGNWGLAE
jgi:hypothetical protein